MLFLNSEFHLFFSKFWIRTRNSLHYIAYLEKGRFFVTSAKLHIPFLSLSSTSPFSPKRGLLQARYFSFSTYINVGRLMLSKRMKGKDKKSKVHPLFSSSHHDIYARAHTHMTLNKTGNKRGLTMMRRNCCVGVLIMYIKMFT